MQYGDRIQLENAKHRNSYMTVSPLKSKLERMTQSQRDLFVPDPEENVLHPSTRLRYEVNASPFIRQFQIVPFQISTHPGERSAAENLPRSQNQTGTGGTKHDVHGLDTVTFCHRESEKILVGSVEDGSAKWILKTLARGPEGNIHPSALWKVQYRGIELGGRALPLQGTNSVLQHVQSGMYLAVRYGCAVLSTDFLDPSCSWSIFAPKNTVSETSKCVTHGKLLWLESLQDAPCKDRHEWLSIETDEGSNLSPHRLQRIASSASAVNPELAPEMAAGGLDALMRKGGLMDKDDLLEIALVDPSFCDSIDYITQCKVLFEGIVQTITAAAPVPDGLSVAQTCQLVIRHPVHRMLARNHLIITKCLNNLVNSCSLCETDDQDPFLRTGPPR